MRQFRKTEAVTATPTTTRKPRKAPARLKGTDHWLTREQVQAVCDAHPTIRFISVSSFWESTRILSN